MCLDVGGESTHTRHLVARADIISLSHAYLLKRLRYDPETGLFIWISAEYRDFRVGSVAGTQTSAYCAISIKGKRYLAHRLAWFYMTGEWPAGLLDHKDGNTKNNKWENIREADFSENMVNSCLRSDNKHGKGVALRKDGKFIARVCFRGVRHHLGAFDTALAASEAYQMAAAKLHGDFMRALA